MSKFKFKIWNAVLQEFVLIFLTLRNSLEMTTEFYFKLYLYCIIRLSVSMDISIHLFTPSNTFDLLLEISVDIFNYMATQYFQIR